MKLLKINVNDDCRLIGVADDEDIVLAIGAFTDADNAEAASNVLYTLLTNLGLVKSAEPQQKLSIADICEAAGKPVAVYIKPLETA